MGADAEGPDDLVRSRLYTRWQEPPPEWLTPDRLEKRRLAGAMRAVIEELDDTGASLGEITEAADELERIAARFARTGRVPAYEGYRESANVGGDIHASFEKSPLIGRANPLAPPVRLRQEDALVVGTARLGSAYEGPPGCVHGGYVAAIFDELLGATQSLSGQPGMTGRLTVHYRRPTPLHTDLVLEGRLEGVEGRKIHTVGTLCAGDTLCAEAEGLFISIDAAFFATLKAARETGRSARPRSGGED